MKIRNILHKVIWFHLIPSFVLVPIDLMIFFLKNNFGMLTRDALIEISWTV